MILSARKHPPIWRKRDELPRVLREHGPPIGCVGVEIGVHRGEFAAHLLSKRSPVNRLVCVDPWVHYEGMGLTDREHEECYRDALVNLVATRGRFEIKRMSSLECAAKTFDTFDFVYLDGDHRYEHVLADIDAWWPLLKDGGIMAGHDFLDEEPTFGVKRAVLERFAPECISLTNEKDEGHRFISWLVVKAED